MLSIVAVCSTSQQTAQSIACSLLEGFRVEGASISLEMMSTPETPSLDKA